MVATQESWPESTPWFRRHQPATLGVAVLLFGAVFGLRLYLGDDASQAISLFYALPIALLAVAYGRLGGAASSVCAIALIAVWVYLEDVDLSLVAWTSRVVPMLLLGLLLGHAVDQLRRADDERRALETAALLHREAIEINDTLVQGMAAAKWSLEASNHDAALRTLTDTIETGHRLVSDLIRAANRASS